MVEVSTSTKVDSFIFRHIRLAQNLASGRFQFDVYEAKSSPKRNKPVQIVSMFLSEVVGYRLDIPDIILVLLLDQGVGVNY